MLLNIFHIYCCIGGACILWSMKPNSYLNKEIETISKDLNISKVHSRIALGWLWPAAALDVTTNGAKKIHKYMC